MNHTRSFFSHEFLLHKVQSVFNTYSHHKARKGDISYSNCLMSALAIFSLKYSSLLKFDQELAGDRRLRKNTQNLYSISHIPSDTYLRESLDDEAFLTPVRTGFSHLFQVLQRTKTLEKWKYLEEGYLVSLDGSGFFSSTTVHCNCCLEAVKNKGTEEERTLYQHQMLVGSLVSPDLNQVIPINFEPITKEDGSSKNECERSCAKKWLTSFRKLHPQLQTIIVADGLYSNSPFINLLKEKRCSFILGAKPGDHTYLYDYFFALEGEDLTSFKKDTPQHHQVFRFANAVPLNEAHYDLKVNVLAFEEYNKKTKKTTNWLWITDIEITSENAARIMKGARARWKIENETFNTLKNQGYEFGHNFGHGYKGLSNVFAGLMLLAFLIDQILEGFNVTLQKLRIKFGSRAALYEKIRGAFWFLDIKSFEWLYHDLLERPPPSRRLLSK